MKLFTSLLGFLVPSILLAGKPAGFVIKPTKGEGPFPVAVWLHGYRGYSPDGYCPGATREALQGHADALGAVIVGFPATTELADGTAQWSEEPVADHAYIQERLKEIARNVKLDLTRVGLFGFSQGAMVAGDLAGLYPECYRGAILMSPGGIGNPHPNESQSPARTGQTFFCLCGEKEAPGNVQLTKDYARSFEKIPGVRVTLKLYAGISTHARPADFMEKFPEWMGQILKKPETAP